MASVYELLGVFLVSFGLNLIPFASPSNLFIASNAALMVKSDPFTLGFIVALGSAGAKSIHYLISFFISKHLGEKYKKRLDTEASKIKRWPFLLLFAVAATPIPDEPVVIPLGLLKYSPTKFFLSFFLGKLSITILGAYLGNWSEALSSVISQQILTVTSIMLTIVVTVLLLKIDIGKKTEKIFNRFLNQKTTQKIRRVKKSCS